MTGLPVPGYAKLRLRKRISPAGLPAAERVPLARAPAGAMAACRRSTAAAGAAAPSSAHDKPPNAIVPIEIAAVA